MQSVCVFCGSSPGRRPAFADAARSLGSALAQRRMALVYGGADVGLMGIIADAVLAERGTVFGVLPAKLRDREIAHQGLTELFIVDSMHERKQKMADLADAFIAMPGGFGTVDELAEVLTWAQLGIHRKPCGLLDVGHFFEPLLRFFDQAVIDGFIRPEHRELLLVDESPERLLDRLAAF